MVHNLAKMLQIENFYIKNLNKERLLSNFGLGATSSFGQIGSSQRFPGTRFTPRMVISPQILQNRNSTMLFIG